MRLKPGYVLIWGDQTGHTCGSGGTIDVDVTYNGEVVKHLTTCVCGRGCGNRACVRDEWGYHDTDIEEYRDDNMVFYPAFGDRRTATHKDILKGYTFDNFREAKLFVSRHGHDSDDAVFTNIDGCWIRVWKQKSDGTLLVSGELEGWIKAVPLHEYLQK